MTPPVPLSKVSLSYSSVQDRIRLTGEVADGAPVALWLTLRICRQLVLQLVRFVEQASSLPAGADRDSLLSFRQSAAALQNATAALPPVADADEPVLLERVDLTFHPALVVLTFWLTPERQAQLALTVEQTLQWLDILYAQYCVAEWPLQVWPEWLAETPASAATPEIRARLH